jgi:hypothetical protein
MMYAQDIMYAIAREEWACYMERTVVRPYVMSFITR